MNVIPINKSALKRILKEAGGSGPSDPNDIIIEKVLKLKEIIFQADSAAEAFKIMLRDPANTEELDKDEFCKQVAHVQKNYTGDLVTAICELVDLVRQSPIA